MSKTTKYKSEIKRKVEEKWHINILFTNNIINQHYLEQAPSQYK